MLPKFDFQAQLPRRRKYLRWLISITVLVLFAFLIWQRVDLQLIGTTLHHADLLLIILAILPINGLAIVFNSLKWQYLLRLYSIDYPFPRIFLLYLIGMFAGFFFSDSLGAFVKAFYVRREGHSLSAAAVTIILDKLTELIIFLGVGFVALYATPALMTDKAQLWVISAVLLTVLVSWLIVRYWQIITNKIQQFIKVYLYRSLQRLPLQSPEYKEASKIKVSEWIWVALLSLASQFLQYLAIYLLMIALGVVLPLGLALVIIITVGLVSMLPILPGGIGTRDAALIIWFEVVNVPVEQALALSVLLLLLYIAWRLAGLIIYLLDPLDWDKLRQINSSSLSS